MPRKSKKKAASKTKKKSLKSRKVSPVGASPSLALVPVPISPTPLARKRWRVHLPKWFLVLLLFLSLQAMLGSGWYLLYRRTILSFKVSPTITATAHLRGSLPVTVTIPTVSIENKVMPATIQDGIWQTSDTTATHLVTSARPGEGGNIVIYAHNRAHLFRNLKDAQKGDVVNITTDNGTVYEYTIGEKKVVTPDEIDVVLPTDHEILTVYTCTGFLDTKRLVVKAYPTKVSSPAFN
jgi:LPXTG-site transpeptidase (sortase) family protein